jgi:hypothetical protein
MYKHGRRKKLRSPWVSVATTKGDIRRGFTIQRFMKQPTDQKERNDDKKKPETENPSHGIDPESKDPEMEVDQDPGERQKENQNQKKDDPVAA